MDSIDLDNSDDLNKIIQRYENMLGNVNEGQKVIRKSGKSLEESWGAHEYRQIQEK